MKKPKTDRETSKTIADWIEDNLPRYKTALEEATLGMLMAALNKRYDKYILWALTKQITLAKLGIICKFLSWIVDDRKDKLHRIIECMEETATNSILPKVRFNDSLVKESRALWDIFITGNATDPDVFAKIADKIQPYEQ